MMSEVRIKVIAKGSVTMCGRSLHVHLEIKRLLIVLQIPLRIMTIYVDEYDMIGQCAY